MKSPIFSSRNNGPGLIDEPGGPANSADLPASVLEPLQAKSGSSCTNPFGQYETQDTSQRDSQAGGACTAFAAASGISSDGGHMGHTASVLYPEGLPKFLGLLRPAMTFGIGHSTLSRGMDFIAHFVAITTLACFFGVLTAVSWMQKLCLPIASYWDHNCTLGFGGFTAVLAIFSWRSATNFDLKRSKVFLFLLGWRLHSFLLLSLLMVLGLALKPQLHAHIENSVRACVVGTSGGEISPVPPPVSTGFAPQAPSFPDGHAITPALSDNKPRAMETLAVTAHAPSDTPSTTAGGTGAAEATEAFTHLRESGITSAGSPSSIQQALPLQERETQASDVQPQHAGAANSGKQSPDIDLFNGQAANAGSDNGDAEAGNGAAANPPEPKESHAAASLVHDATSAEGVSASPAGEAPRATPSSEAGTGSEPLDSETHAEGPSPALLRESPQMPQTPAPTLAPDGQKLALEAAQRSAVQESNAVVVVVLILASLALLFELYLVYACWSFKVWMERGYESVVLAGAPPFSTMDAGSGWLAYAVRMPQTVQMETYGNDACGTNRLPLFVQTTDTSDCAAHLGLPITGRW